jgi:hypothetical protein
MEEHLTVAELLATLKQCKGYAGGDTCVGCPNAVPGTEDKDGFCQCRFDTYDETIRILESLVTNN